MHLGNITLTAPPVRMGFSGDFVFISLKGFLAVSNTHYSFLFFFHSAPCPLSSFHPLVDCSTGVVSVAWNNSMPGVVYTVSAVDTEGYIHNCSGTNSGCDINTLECGTEYNITITPSWDTCVGRESKAKMIKTGTIIFF